jgi:hypothetical protein
VLAYNPKPVFYAVPAARRAGVRSVVAMISGLGYAFTSQELKARALALVAMSLYRRSLPLADRVVFQNSDDRQMFDHLGLLGGVRDVQVIPGSGVDLARFAEALLPSIDEDGDKAVELATAELHALADTFEALIGAVHLDGGFAAAQAVVERLFEPQLRSSDLATSGRDAKTTLQELLQQHRQPPPDYALVSTAGPDHQQVFTVMCRVPAHDLAGMGSGPSRRAAEQAAAAVVHLELVEKLGLT